jgi:hypothetical protein
MVGASATKCYTSMDRFKKARTIVAEDASRWFG